MEENFVFSATTTRSDQEMGEPPDGGGGVNRNMIQAGVSFRDKMMGGRSPPPMMEEVDLVGQNLMKIVYEEGNRLKPKVYLDDAVFEKLCLPWQDALIVKLLGKTIGFMTMRERLKQVWKLHSGFDLMDVGNGFFVVKFEEESAREKVMTGGPWMIFDHYLSVQRWEPDFVSPSTQVNKTLVWIRFPGLNLMFFDKSFLLGLASAVGVPSRVDMPTVNVARGKFARVCVEIDLTVPVVGKVWFRDHWYKVEYEGLHLICAKCGCYGHLSRDCATLPPNPSNVQSPVVEGGAPVQEVTVTGLNQDGNQGNDSEISKEGTDITTGDPEDALHGEWLVVRRRNKGGKEKIKGVAAERTKDGIAEKNKGVSPQSFNIKDSSQHKILQQHDNMGTKPFLAVTNINSPFSSAQDGTRMVKGKKRARRENLHVTKNKEKERHVTIKEKRPPMHVTKESDVRLSPESSTVMANSVSQLAIKGDTVMLNENINDKANKKDVMPGFDLGTGIVISPDLLRGTMSQGPKQTSKGGKALESKLKKGNSGPQASSQVNLSKGEGTVSTKVADVGMHWDPGQ
ncbi:uncharacterized protein LOC109791283 [Cajanus cajan]|uniref:uncharacterized protein LOC109791283 n=1 Tax=Cajanus cajan TaxID=3821 RepID=UPI00098DC5F0|nr:uncharacterized protein LOC109791283 [Cajanus cajan]